MGRSKPAEEQEGDWGSVRIHRDLLGRVDRFMGYSEDGFTTRSGVVSEALRLYLRAKEQEWRERQDFEARVKASQEADKEAKPAHRRPWPDRR